MTGIVMGFRGSKGQIQPGLFLPEGMAEALADAMQHAAPAGRRKYIEGRLKIDSEAARRVAEGRASKAQLDHAFKVGGWPLVLEVFARLLGEGLDQHLERERRRHAELAEDLGKWSAISVLLLLEVLGAALAWLPLNLATWAKDTRRKLQKGSGDG